MSAYAPAARTAAPRPADIPRAAARSTVRRPAAPAAPAAPSRPDREALRREHERAERARAQAERMRDNLAARHPLSLR